MNDPKKIKCSFIKITELQKRSREFREKYWPENILPINIEKIIEQRLGLDIIPVPLLPVDAWLQSNTKAVIVNSTTYNDERYDNRLRFSLAHEIGHYILHARVYKLFPHSSMEEYQLFIQSIPEEEYNDFEWQANEFAGSLLVPRVRLLNEIEHILSMYQKAGADRLIRNSPDEVLPRVSARIARPFGVSHKVIERRAEIEKLWPPQEIL